MAEDNYRIKLRRLAAEGKLPAGPGLFHCQIRHDDWCAGFEGKPCNCDPDISFISDETWQRQNLS